MSLNVAIKRFCMIKYLRDSTSMKEYDGNEIKKVRSEGCTMDV